MNYTIKRTTIVILITLIISITILCGTLYFMPWSYIIASTKQQSESPLWDLQTLEHIQKLHPVIRDDVYTFLYAAQQNGIYLKIISSYRTITKQNSLYNEGRVNTNPIITYVPGGYSWHNYGLAFDVVEVIKNTNTTKWDNNNWLFIGQLGEQYGFTWGGRWNAETDGLIDKPHFEKTYDYDITDIKSLYDAHVFTDYPPFVCDKLNKSLCVIAENTNKS